MTPQLIFTVCNTVAIAGWLVLLFFPFWYESDKYIVGIVIALFCIVYAWLIFSSFPLSNIPKFATLDGVKTIFMQEEMVVAGWVHYLAFDLLTGIFIRRNSIKHGISPWIIFPILLITFALGPIGLLLYLIVRSVASRRYFVENF